MFCPNCGVVVSDEANFCEKCGFKLREGSEGDMLVDAPSEISVELVEKEENKLPCEWCKGADLEVVSEPEKPKLYRCPSCGHYFGNFMRKGSDIYYDTIHLRVGQYVASQLVHGKYRVSAHKNQREQGLEDIAERIQHDVKLDRKKIREALSYLIEKNVLYTYYEPTPDEEFEWFGIDFMNNIPGEGEITR